MHLLGDRAWWIPRWLDRLLPDLDVEGLRLAEHLEAQAAAPARPARRSRAADAAARRTRAGAAPRASA